MGDEKRRKAREASRKFEAAHREERNEKMRLRRQRRRAELGPAKLRGPNKKPAKNALPPELAAEAARIPGETEIEWRRRYNRVKTRHYRMKHPERERENRRKNQSTPEYKDKARAYQSANLEGLKRRQKKYF